MRKTIAQNSRLRGDEPMARMVMRTTFFVLIAFVAMSLMVPLEAFANSGASAANQFTYAPDSYFINVILQGILGTVVQSGANATTAGQSISATGTNTLGEVFRTFDIGVAFFGSLMIVFTTVVGVLQSGNDGEFLGRKWSSMWVPIRFATGSALMLPLTSSGYSYCQAIVLWIAGQGVGFADTLWNTIVAKLIVKNGMTLSQGVDMGTVTRSMAISELCTAVVNDRNAAAAAAGGVSVAPISLVITDNTKNYVRTFAMNWTRPGADFSSAKSANCGSVTYSVDASVSALSDPYKNVRLGMLEFHIQNLKPLAESYRDAALKVAAKYSASTGTDAGVYDPRADLIAISEKTQADAINYTAAMGVKVTELLAASGYKTQLTANSGDMTRYGFAMAGLWYMELLKVHNTARYALNAPTAGGANLKSLESDPGIGNFVSTYNDINTIIISASDQDTGDFKIQPTQLDNGGATIRTTTTNFSISTDSLISSGKVDNLFSSFSNWIRSAVFGVGQYSNGTSESVYTFRSGVTNTNAIGTANSRDPNVSTILQLKDKGDVILNVTSVIMSLDVASKVVVGVGNYLRDSGPVGAVANSFGSLLGGAAKVASYVIDKMGVYLIGAAVSLFLFGVMLSVYVPMIPYILWVGAILGLVILILESLVAIMLWAVMMMHPSGDGITSDYNRQGLNMLLAVFMRPALLLMGLVLGMFMVEPMVMFVNDTFYIMMKSVQADTVTGIFSTIAFIAIYVSLIMMIVEKSFSMIHVVPDRVLTWIGGPGALTGEEQEITGRARNMISGAGGAANTILLGRGAGGGRTRPAKAPTAPAA